MISVIIPNWNGAKHLPVCLAALRRQTAPPLEVIIVDNASADESRELVARDYPEVKWLQLPQNVRFAGACNAGIRASSGEFVALLNNDTEADERWLENIAKTFAEHPSAGFAATKLRLFDQRDKLHSAGDFYSRRGVPGNRGVWQVDDGRFDAEYVFGACGAGSVYRREMLDKIGLLDEEFEFSCEDVDISWRAQLAGYRCAFAKDAIVYHKVSATGGGVLNSFYDGRNFIWLLVKDVPSEVLRANLGAILREQFGITLSAINAWRGKAAQMRLKGQLAGVAGIPRMLRRRRAVQAARVIDAAQVNALLD
ncbi:MAG TPA: glycosyltransferase family 2 protein [Thermoflexales bacterium]|nr:glycosyltransferase family 2 protein [Thermoflexales bacterium]HQW36475.1 glycosyltransferase family 2 protein [Thermoflexales bacterium]